MNALSRFTAALPSLSQFITSAASPSINFSRSIVSVDVFNNNVDRALRTLKRKLIDEGMVRQWQANKTYLKPAEERKLQRIETEKRLRKRAFKDKMRWIMKRGQRGF